MIFSRIKRHYHPCTYVLDERLRVLRVIPVQTEVQQHVRQVIDVLASCPDLPVSIASIQAPVLVVCPMFLSLRCVRH